MSEIDTLNRFGVASGGNGVALLMPPARGQLLSEADALILAAWLVAMADPEGDEFRRVLAAVLST